MSCSQPRLRRRRLTGAQWAIVATSVVCAAALLFRTPLRARYWAWRLSHAHNVSERSAYLTALCQAGPAARWGVSALMSDPRAEVRQYAVLTLQYLNTEWSRATLLEAAGDADTSVRRLAASALALRGDDAAVPILKWLYQAGDESSPATACLGLTRLGSPAAITALNELALEPGETWRRSALVDALANIGKPECVPGLVNLLEDERAYTRPAPEILLGAELTAELEAAGYRLSTATSPTTAGAVTIAQRAAEALARITALALPCDSREQRTAAARQWSDWYEQQTQR